MSGGCFSWETLVAGALTSNGQQNAVAVGAPLNRPFVPYVYRGTGEDTLTAFMDDEPDKPRPPGRPRSHPCGTTAASRRHYRRGEAPCQACRDAERLRHAEGKGAS